MSTPGEVGSSLPHSYAKVLDANNRNLVGTLDP